MKFLASIVLLLFTQAAFAGSPVIWGSGKAQLLPAQLCFSDTTCMSTAATAAPTHPYWSGYHDSTCSWARTNAAIGDFATDASCALTAGDNSGMGSVTGSNDLPKIVLASPPRTGEVEVCATFSGTVSNDVVSRSFQIFNGSAAIAETGTVVRTDAGTQISDNITLCGYSAVTSAVSITFTIRGASSAGALTITRQGVARSAIEWRVKYVD